MIPAKPAFRVNRRLEQVLVCPGPLLLAQLPGPDLAEHRRLLGPISPRSRTELQALTAAVKLAGRGGAAFPFADKLAAVGSRDPVIIVNGTETEPGSAKDAVLLARCPHLVLDGAALCAQALGSQTVHLVVPSPAAISRPVLEAVRQRSDPGITWQVHPASDRFVGGQSTAVVELLSGRADIPAAHRVPTAKKGLHGQPTLLSNVETFAQLASLARIGADQYIAHGYPGHPGTVLITADPDSPDPYVAELPGGTRLADAIAPRWNGQTPILVGGYHGAWVRPEEVNSVLLSHHATLPTLGAGVLTPLTAATCPIRYTEHAIRFLASETAAQCGPCARGLPALSSAMTAVYHGQGPQQEVLRLAELVTGRGLCAHPDGTAALAACAIAQFPAEVAEHERGRCSFTAVDSNPWPTSALFS